MDGFTTRKIKGHWTYKKLMRKTEQEGKAYLNEYSLLRPFFAFTSEEQSINRTIEHRKNNRTLFVEYCAHAIACEHEAWLRMSKRFKASGDKVYCLNEAAKTRLVLENLKNCIHFLTKE